MVAEQQQQSDLTPDNDETSGRASRSLRKLVLGDFLEVIGGGDALTKEASKEYQEALASRRREAEASRSNTYRPGANMPDVAWKPPGHEPSEAEAAAEGDTADRTASEAQEALRTVLGGRGVGVREDILAGAL